MDENQADAASEALMAEAMADQRRQAAHLHARQVKPSWRAFGLGLMGCGVGIAIGSGSDNGLLFGALGFAIGMALAAAIARRQA